MQKTGFRLVIDQVLLLHFVAVLTCTWCSDDYSWLTRIVGTNVTMLCPLEAAQHSCQ